MDPELMITELDEKNLPFLLSLWHIPDVMRYADEFPRLRGWSRLDEPKAAWAKYQEQRSVLGLSYTQFVLCLIDGTPIGESFFMPLPKSYTFGKWQKPEGVESLMGDIKLKPAYWNRGLGTEGMRQVVKWLFSNTGCEVLIVPPHRKNPAATRMYDKAGFEMFTGMRSWRNHKVMELWRERYEMIRRCEE